MTEVAILSYAQAPMLRQAAQTGEVELIMPVVRQAMADIGITQQDIDFTCSGSCDYLQGAPFAFVDGLNALSTVPSIKESHVEMDAAWALYESWLKIRMGQAELCLLYGFGRSSPGSLRQILSLQLDPYYMVPLWPDSIALAALQAKAMEDAGALQPEDMARVVARSRANARANPNAQLAGEPGVEELLAEPLFMGPLRRHDCPPITDGASAMVIASADRARQLCERPAFIRSLEHRIETGQFQLRDLTDSPSARQAAIAAREAAGMAPGAPGTSGKSFDLAELHAPFSHQEVLLTRVLGLDDEQLEINPSGGCLAGNTFMAAGLDRFGAAARRIWEGRADRALVHATSGPCLQQNMVAVLEGE